jgi:phage protein D
MVTSPFFRISVADTGEDITDLCDGLDYEESAEKDDLLNITIKTKNVFLIDEEWLAVGEKLYFIFGYKGGFQSGRYVATIADVDIDYGVLTTIKIKCSDAGAFAKNTTSNKIWKDVTATNIAEQLADKYDLTLQANPTSKKYSQLPQGNKNDFDFLREVAQKENLQFYIASDQLIFKPRDLLKASIRTYTLGVDILKFKPSTKTSKDAPSSQAAQSTSINPVDGSINTQKVTNTDKENALQGSYVIDYAKGKTTKVSRKQDSKETETVLNPSSDSGETKKQLANRVQNSMQNAIKATLEVEGDPNLKVNEIITIAAVAKKHEGNYLIVSIKHRINRGGYFCTVELSKNATGKSVTAKKEQKGSEQLDNNSIGNSKTTQKRNPVQYVYE